MDFKFHVPFQWSCDTAIWGLYQKWVHMAVIHSCKGCIYSRCEDGKSLSAPKTVVLNRLYLLPRLLSQAHDNTHYVPSDLLTSGHTQTS